MSNKVKSIIYLGVALLSATFAIVMSREAKEKTALDVVGETFVDVDPREGRVLNNRKSSPRHAENALFVLARALVEVIHISRVVPCL